MMVRNLLVCMTALGVASAANAYVLPAGYLVRMLVEQRQDQNIRDLSIRLQTEVEESSVLEGHLYLKSPERLRRVEEDDGIEKVYVVREGKQASGTGQNLRRLNGLSYDLTSDLLIAGKGDIDAQTTHLFGVLKAYGIDTSVVALSRSFDQRPVYVIGARARDLEKPQLWMDKSTLLPVRVMITVEGKRYDMRYLEYGSPVDKNLTMRSEVVEVRSNQKLPESLFRIP